MFGRQRGPFTIIVCVSQTVGIQPGKVTWGLVLARRTRVRRERGKPRFWDAASGVWTGRLRGIVGLSLRFAPLRPVRRTNCSFYSFCRLLPSVRRRFLSFCRLSLRRRLFRRRRPGTAALENSVYPPRINSVCPLELIPCAPAELIPRTRPY